MAKDIVDVYKGEVETYKKKMLSKIEFDKKDLEALGMEEFNALKLKHGTTIMGAAHNNEAVLGGDTQASMGSMIATTKIRKLRQVGDNVVVGGAGAVSHIYAIMDILDVENDLYNLKNEKDMTADRAVNVMKSLIQEAGGVYAGFVVAGIAKNDKGEKYVTVYDVEGSGSYLGGSETDYKTVGSGSPWAEGKVNDFFYDIEETGREVDLDTMVENVVRGIQSAKRSDTYSGGGITAYTVTLKDGVQEVPWEDLETKYHAKNIKRRGQ